MFLVFTKCFCYCKFSPVDSVTEQYKLDIEIGKNPKYKLRNRDKKNFY